MRNFFYRGLVVYSLILLSGCGSKQTVTTQVDLQKNELKELTLEKTDEVAFQPFVVYADKGSRDNHFVPSGFMPNGRCVNLEDGWSENCHSGTCIKITYDVVCSQKDQKWAGLYWLNPANNWGKMKGGFNLNGATRLTFWAKGEAGGEQINEFKIGGIAQDYPDSDSASIGPVLLTSEWKQYTIDLRGKDLSYISGGFMWASSSDVNASNVVFYLDDVQYE